MMATASWKKGMIAADVRLAALVAINKGWYVKSAESKDYPFSRAELPVAASYLGHITPQVPEDPADAFCTMMNSLSA